MYLVNKQTKHLIPRTARKFSGFLLGNFCFMFTEDSMNY